MTKYRYRIRSGNYVLKSRAEKRVEKLKKAGFSAFIYQTEKSVRYKVQVGMFDSKSNAKDYQRVLKERGFNSKIIRIKIMFQARLNRSGMAQLPYWKNSEGNPYPRLPNCTCYTFGRWWEILGYRPDVLKFTPGYGNGGLWYDQLVNKGLLHGSTPRLGAIACWKDPAGNNAGHVAVVEQIIDNETILTSNSGYTRESAEEEERLYFWTETCTYVQGRGYCSSWELSAQYNYTNQGFIYLPSDPVNPEWISDNRYLNQYEIEHNAQLAYRYLFSVGYTHETICAILGNMQQESGINPGIWENLQINPSRGYGLVQWTPSTYYTDWATQNGYSISDGYPQLLWVDTVLDSGGYWVQRNGYNITYDNFKNNTDLNSIDYLTSAWYYNFENPGSGDTSLDARKQYAHYWDDYFQDYDPANPENPPVYEVNTNLKWWMVGRRLTRYGY